MKTFYPSTNQCVLGGDLQMVEAENGDGAWAQASDLKAAIGQGRADRLAVGALQLQINTLKAGVLGKYDAKGLAQVIAALREDAAGGTKATMSDLDLAANALEYICTLADGRYTAEPEPVVLASDVPASCDGKEQEAFEQWARDNRYGLRQHPLHYLFLDPRTDGARQGWKAGMTYAVGRMTSKELTL